MKEILTLKLLKDSFGVCRLDHGNKIPKWALSAPWYSITNTQEELSIVCTESFIPDGINSEKSWRSFMVEGSLAFEMIGVLAMLSNAMAKHEISIFAISTYDTDYILMKEDQVQKAKKVFEGIGLIINEEEGTQGNFEGDHI